MNKVLILIFITLSTLGATKIRSEMSRFRLLKDRYLVEKQLDQQEHSTFFDLNLQISSGLKRLNGDISDATSEDSTVTEQIVTITEVLSKHINTERSLMINAELGLPLPGFVYSGYHFIPSVFAEFYTGASLSINNVETATVPVAQVYLQKTIDIGVYTKFYDTTKPSNQYSISLYKRSRADLSASRGAIDIATTNEIAATDELTQDEESYMLNFSYQKIKKKFSYIMEVRELKIQSINDHETRYGTTPLFHFRYDKNYLLGSYILKTMFGVHHSKSYSIMDSLYFGSTLKPSKDSPLIYLFKLDNETLGFKAGLEFSHFRFTYGMKTPYRNPIDEFWTSATHQIHLSVPF